MALPKSVTCETAFETHANDHPLVVALARHDGRSQAAPSQRDDRPRGAPSAAQGPITVFIHHNTLHAFEDLPFDEAVKKGARVFGCHPYLTEDRYREEVRRGRIRFSDLREVLERDLGERTWEEIPCFGTRLELRLAMLQYPLRTGPTEELVWYVAEANALRRVRAETSSAVRARLIAETRRWVMRDLRGRSELRGGLGQDGRRARPPGQPRRAARPLRRVDDRELER